MRFVSFFVTFGLFFPLNAFAWECGSIKAGTCVRNLERENSSYAAFSDPALTCYNYLLDKDDLTSGVTYCPYFQCDSDGNVLLHDNSIGAYIEEKPAIKGMKNCGGYFGPAYTDGTPTTNGCYSNCCYVDGKFSGSINYGPARNLCCKTLAAYKAADCTLDDKFLEEMEQVVGGDQNGNGTVGDLIGDGSIEEDVVEGSQRVVSGNSPVSARKTHTEATKKPNHFFESNQAHTISAAPTKRGRDVISIDRPLF